MRWRWWLLLLLVGAASLAVSPAPWQTGLRAFLTWRAARQGWDLQIGAMDGGLFDATQLYNVRCVQHHTRQATPPNPSGATEFEIQRVELVFAWKWVPHAGSAWLSRLAVDGLSGTCDLTPVPPDRTVSAWQIAASGDWRLAARTVARHWLERGTQGLGRQLARLDHELAPTEIAVRGGQFTLERGRYRLQTNGLNFTAVQDGPGWFSARQAETTGPQFDNALQAVSGWTFWKGASLTLGDADLGRGVHLTHATLNGAHLDHRRLDWDGELTALGGSARGQGAVDFTRRRLSLEIAGSLEKMAVSSLSKLLGVSSETGGEVQQANFTFRGDPENWTAAEMWLAAEATDFRWGQRRWESLELRGMVLNRRVQVHRLELRQSHNQLSFTGECALPATGQDAATLPALAATAWWQAGFSCNIDARVDDLHALAQLAGGQVFPVSGRMSVNGTLGAHPGSAGIDGYLNVEGSNLSIRGAPLDYLRTTLLFQGDELHIPDVQATRGGDYLTGQGTIQILGPARYKAELHASIKDLAVYAPAYADLPFSPEPLHGSLLLNWSGDGAPGASSGAFQGTTDQFFTKAGPMAFSRPINLDVDGTYSPDSVSFRRLVLKDGAGDTRREALKLTGALPWTRDAQAFAAGRWLDPAREMSIRVECNAAPLDLLGNLAPGAVVGADGQISGWLNADGTWRSPKLDADLELQNASLRFADGSPALEGVAARVRMEKSVLRVEQAKGHWGTNDVEIAGSIDLSETAKIGLDLAMNGKDTAGVHVAALDSGLGYALTWRGVAGGAAILGGELTLTGARFAQLVPLGGGEELSSLGGMELARRLPAVLRATTLDLHVTAAPEMRFVGGEAAAVMPDFQLTGTVSKPELDGTLTFRDAPLRGRGDWRGVGSGTWYYSAGEPGNPTVSMSATADGAQFFLYGGLQSIEMVPVPAASAEFNLAPSGETSLWSEADAMAAFAPNALVSGSR